jgi:hypothetical protein
VGWAGSHIALRGGRALPDGTHTATMATNGRADVASADRITVRVIEYQVDGGETIRLLTNLLDPEDAPAAEIARLSTERRQTEQADREIKTIQQGRPHRQGRRGHRHHDDR